MIGWWIAPAIFSLVVLMVTFWVATCRQSHCELLAAVFLMLSTPVAIVIWSFFYLLSFIP